MFSKVIVSVVVAQIQVRDSPLKIVTYLIFQFSVSSSKNRTSIVIPSWDKSNEIPSIKRKQWLRHGQLS